MSIHDLILSHAHYIHVSTHANVRTHTCTYSHNTPSPQHTRTQAISLLQGLPKNSEVCSMMAKVQHKAGQYREAADNFLTALGEHPAMEEEKRLFYCQGLRKEDMATLHLLCAENYLASGDVKRAIEQFTQVLECDPRNDMVRSDVISVQLIGVICVVAPMQAYYRRGWAKLKLDNSKGILDINKALAINPSLFQVEHTPFCRCIWQRS